MSTAMPNIDDVFRDIIEQVSFSLFKACLHKQ
jgi:hypothetical protein